MTTLSLSPFRLVLFSVTLITLWLGNNICPLYDVMIVGVVGSLFCFCLVGHVMVIRSEGGEAESKDAVTAEGTTTPTLREMVVGWMDSLNEALSVSTMKMFGAVLEGAGWLTNGLDLQPMKRTSRVASCGRVSVFVVGSKASLKNVLGSCWKVRVG